MPYRPPKRRSKRPRPSEDERDDDALRPQPDARQLSASPAPTEPFILENTVSTPGEGNSQQNGEAAEEDIKPDLASSSPARSAETLTAPAWSGPLVGYCFCQDWKVTIKEPISGVVVCHCKDCQAISSSFFCTFLTVKNRGLLMVEPRDREARNVESSTYYYNIKSGDNVGKSQSRTFCKRCGTVLFATPESLEGALPVNRNLFVGSHADLSPALTELLTPRIEIFTKDRSDWRPGQEGILHQYNSMPVGFGDSGGGSNDGDAASAAHAGDIHI